MSYTPEHGDIYIISDKKQLAFTVGDGVKGTNYSLIPNQWYNAGQQISKGQAVAIGTSEYVASIGTGNAGDVYIASEGILEKTCGIALNNGQLRRSCVFSVSSITGAVAGNITLGGGVSATVTLTANDITSLNAVATKIAAATYTNNWTAKATNAQLTFLNPSTSATPITISAGSTNISFSAVVTTTVGDLIEVQSFGLHTWDSNLFVTSDIGNTAYVAPGTFTYSSALADQYTTNRSRAAASGYPLIEVGIVKSANTLFIDFEGDSRGSVTTTQVTAPAGEALTTNNTPMLVCMGTDGKIYFADRRKSQDGVMTTSTFTVNSVASATAGTVILAGGASATITLTSSDILSTSAVAAKIAAASVANWTLSAVGSTVTMYSPISGINAPTIALGTATNITFSTVTTSTAGLGRTKPLGFIVSADSNFSGTIPLNTNCLVQRLGTISCSTWAFTPGKPIYNDVTGTYTQNTTTFSNYTDVCDPVATALSATSIYVQVAYSTQTSDAESLASIIACNSTGTADYGYLLCCGSTMNATTTTTNPTGQVAGTYDGTGLFNKIGSCFGGAIQYTVSGTTTVGANFSINGIVYTTTGTTAAALVTQIAAITQSNYTFASVSTYVFRITNIAGYSTPSIVAPSGITIVISGGTYTLPNLNASTLKLQIKYLNWYAANPSVAPVYRYDTGWTQYPNVPSNCTGTGVNGGYIEVPVSSFGSDPDATELIAEIYASKNGVYRKLDCAAHIDPLTSNARYGYQINKDISNYIRIDTSLNGLAYFNYSNQVWTTLDSTWQYKIIISKAEKYNKFYDYSADQKLAQLWSLGLIDYTAPYTTQSAGKLDRSSSFPIHSTRMNYDGILYATDYYCTGGKVVTSSTITNYTKNLNRSFIRSVFIPTFGNSSSTLSSTYSSRIAWSPELSIFCAVPVSTTSQVFTSTDGITWTSHVPGVSVLGYSICWSSELSIFCVLSYESNTNYAMLSSDGITWARYTISIATAVDIRSLCWSSDLKLFCAVGAGSSYNLTSSDGINWIESSMPSTTTWMSVCWSSELGIFCAVSLNSSTVAATSTNGTTWTLRTLATSSNYISVCWSPELRMFCALSQTNNFINISYNGINWSRVDLPISSSSYLSITWSSDLGIFLITAQGYFLTSSDGINWSIYYSEDSTHAWGYTIWASNLGRYLLVYTDGTPITYVSSYVSNTVAATSIVNSSMVVSNSAPTIQAVYDYMADYQKWQTIPQVLTSSITVTPTTNSCGENVIGISKQLKRMIMLPRYAVSLYGNYIDLSTYTSSAITLPATSAYSDICWSDTLGIFVAVGSPYAVSRSTSVIIYSYDGSTWYSATSPISNSITGICWNPDMKAFFAVSTASNGGTLYCIKSSNGINWTSASIGSATVDNGSNSIIYNSSIKALMVLVNMGASLYYSYSGSSWTSLTAPLNVAGAQLIFSRELNQLICAAPGLSYYYISNNNGTSWSRCTYFNKSNYRLSAESGITYISQIHAYVGKFIIATTETGSQIGISNDGYNWTFKAHLVTGAQTTYSFNCSNATIAFDPINYCIINTISGTVGTVTVYKSAVTSAFKI